MRRVWSLVAATWGGVLGVAPHVLHHVGPLAGAALLAGAGGTVLFAVAGFAASIPFLLRLRRRFRTWAAPALATAAFAGMFTLSTLVIGPALAGRGSRAQAPNQGSAQRPSPGVEGAAGHASHH